MSSAAEATEATKLELKRHATYFKYILKLLPASATSIEVNRLTVVFFAVSGLDVLDALDAVDKQRQAIIDWLYSLQITSDTENGKFAGGFRGGPFLGRKYHAHAHEDHAAQNATDGADQCCNESIHLDFSHITMTFTALAILVILGDDLSRVDKTAIISSLKNLQRPDGSYSAIHGGSENDMRFLYCACIISYIINDWSGVDVERALQFVRDSHSYDMGIAQGPGQEAHGGSTYCALAALSLMGKLDEGLVDAERTLLWLLRRQETGFNGRPNKLVDTCYAFWVGGSINILKGYKYVNPQLLRSFLLDAQQPSGGFGKTSENQADPLHAYFGLCGLSFLQEPGLLPIDAPLNMTLRSAARIKETVFWKPQN